jgi:nicotinamide mononucleotide transporter
LEKSEFFPGSGSVAGVDSETPTAINSSAGANARLARRWFGLSLVEIWFMAGASLWVLLASYRAWWSIGVTEAWGFVTGGVCVWLVVREHVWNWPVGLANNVFFFVIFLQSRLFADMSLQVVYLALGIYGWLNWVFGGQNRTTLRITRTTRLEWIGLVIAIPICTWILRDILLRVNGAAPFWDSLTTVLSLVAQYLLCRKRLENWAFWIAADIIYVPLYLSRQLPLTALLYAVFLCMCLVGVHQWWRSLQQSEVHP